MRGTAFCFTYSAANMKNLLIVNGLRKIGSIQGALKIMISVVLGCKQSARADRDVSHHLSGVNKLNFTASTINEQSQDTVPQRMEESG